MHSFASIFPPDRIWVSLERTSIRRATNCTSSQASLAISLLCLHRSLDFGYTTSTLAGDTVCSPPLRYILLSVLGASWDSFQMVFGRTGFPLHLWRRFEWLYGRGGLRKAQRHCFATSKKALARPWFRKSDVASGPQYAHNISRARLITRSRCFPLRESYFPSECRSRHQ